jgi:peptidoglycan/xylan/chitin deacetylase (PgdA/CDA1 family)
MRLAAVSIDLDEIHHYRAIHGLPPAEAGAHAAYDRALPRAAEWAKAHDLPLTLFAVGTDLSREGNAAIIRELAAKGHEIANHSLSHRYDLTLMPRSGMEEEVRGGAAAIGRVTGTPPAGFRAPGYLVNDELLEVVRDSGAAYDSSVFPSPPYYAAKAAKLFSMRLRGRASRSVLDSPNVLRAPTRPYRLGRPYWQAGDGNGLLELPVQVTPGTRLPFIGTSLVLAGPDGARLLARTLLAEPLVNLELHAIDFLGSDDGLDGLAKHQPDVRVPFVRKVAALTAVVELLRSKGFGFVRLDEAARANA